MAKTVLLPDEVLSYRNSALANGYKLLCLRTGKKSPAGKGWTNGEQRDVLLNVRHDALNTGLILTGMRVIDIDVDDQARVLEIARLRKEHLPSGALSRRRPDSPRFAVLYRAESGDPRKRSIAGQHGKIEILGAGQYLHCHGLHPDGAMLSWVKGRGPDTIPYHQLAAVSEQQIASFLDACRPIVGVPTQTVSVAGAADPGVIAANNELSGGIETPEWFPRLPPHLQSGLLRACFSVLENRYSDPRDRWLRALFGACDAEQLGCQDAHEIALEWSERGASWKGEVDFDTTWDSFKPGWIGVGTLLAMAREQGLDLSPWRDSALKPLLESSCTPEPGSIAPSPPVALPQARQAVAVADLPLVPKKRQWLHGTDLARGAVALLVAPGARGKSSFLIVLSLACASGRHLLGSHVFGGPLRVLLINAEDSTAEVALRVRASMQHHGLSDAEVPDFYVAGADILGLSLLQVVRGTPALNQAALAILNAELDRLRVDVLIIDPLISVMGGASTNDNAAAALLMGQLVALAAERRIAIVVAHHAAKGRDPTSAESAMGAASFVNLARIVLNIDPLAEADAGLVGIAPWEARSVFRVVGTKQNLSPPGEGDKFFRLVGVQMNNAEPPVYQTGDSVAVVEQFYPGSSGSTYPAALIRDVLQVIESADPPLSPSRNAKDRFAGDAIRQAMAPHRGGRATEGEAKAVLNHIQRSGLVAVEPVQLGRDKGRHDTRNGLRLTAAGKQAAHAQDTPA